MDRTPLNRKSSLPKWHEGFFLPSQLLEPRDVDSELLDRGELQGQAFDAHGTEIDVGLGIRAVP